MRLALIADAFPPMRTSCAVQLRDLSRELLRQGHAVTVIVPSEVIERRWMLEDMEGVRVLRLRAPKIKNISYVLRGVSEFFMPFFMRRNLYKSPLAYEQWDGIVWYSPSIFHGPLVRTIKLASKCKSYLIVRDVFPQWAADMGLMSKRGLPYIIFNAVARYQYSLADTIGIQTPGNQIFFEEWNVHRGQGVEVLQNWLSDTRVNECTISLSNTKLAGRKIFVYAGNMGVAQKVSIFLDLAELLRDRLDVGFVFVGRGTEFAKISEEAMFRRLDNVLFFDEIHPDEIFGLYAQCAVGLVALDPRHKSHNIPGKFLTYMQAGLPVLASINSNNDLIEIIQNYNVGRVSVGGNQEVLELDAQDLLSLLDVDHAIKDRCRNLYLECFTPDLAARQIVDALVDRK